MKIAMETDDLVKIVDKSETQ